MQLVCVVAGDIEAELRGRAGGRKGLRATHASARTGNGRVILTIVPITEIC